ncbi:MAG: hypothetical protein JXQ71_06685 [Verrucomicrobia bacterium]|nr:hypothetical protein [Verrucomicrobiota bacterium]
MPDKNELTPAELELELHLAGLQPAQHGIKPEIVFFRAGQKSALRRLRRWQAASSLMVLATLGLWAWHPSPKHVSESPEMVFQDHRHRAPQPAVGVARALPSERWVRRSGTREYLRLRTEVLTRGLEVLPSPSLTPAPSKSVDAVSHWRRFVTLTPAAGPPAAHGPQT